MCQSAAVCEAEVVVLGAAVDVNTAQMARRKQEPLDAAQMGEIR